MEQDSTLHHRLMQAQMDRIEADLLDLKYQFQDFKSEFRSFRSEANFLKMKFQQLSGEHEFLRNRFEQLKQQFIASAEYRATDHHASDN